ncbi:unnamed protein product [Closterium sp. NIES-54]
MARSVATSAPRCPALLSRPPLPLIIGALFALLLLGLFLSSPPTPSLPTSVPAPLLSRPPLPLIIGALFALLLLGLFLSSPPTPSLPTSVPARDRLANFHPVSEVGGELSPQYLTGDILSVQVVYHRPPNKYDYQWALSGVPSQKELQTMLQQQQQQQQQQGGGGGNEEGSEAREQQHRRYPYRPLPHHHPAGASLHNASLKWRVDPLVGGLGGYFRDKGSHQLDLLDFWFGPVVAVSGWSTNLAGLYPSPDTVTAHLRFANGIVGTGSWNFAAGKSSQQEYGEITGSSGRIKFQFFLSNKVELWNDTGHYEWDDPSPEHVQQPLLATAVSALRGQGECPSVGESAIRTSFILDKIVNGEKWP